MIECNTFKFTYLNHQDSFTMTYTLYTDVYIYINVIEMEMCKKNKKKYR